MSGCGYPEVSIYFLGSLKSALEAQNRGSVLLQPEVVGNVCEVRFSLLLQPGIAGGHDSCKVDILGRVENATAIKLF